VWERSSRLHWAGLTVARKLGIPYVLEWKDHLVPYSFSLLRSLALRVERRKEEQSAAIVVESGVLKTALAAQLGSGKNIIVAQNAVDMDVFHSSAEGRRKFRAAWNVADDEFVVGYMGSYAFYHDCTTFVRAAKIALGRYPANSAKKLRFVMIGAGKQYAETAALAQAEGLLGSVLLMLPGVPLDQAPAALSAFDVSVLPGSTDIICPVKVMEFMAAETPAVVPDYACNREVLTDGETGVLFTPGNAEDLAAKLLQLAEQPEWCRELGGRARRVAIEQFSWDRTWGKALKDIVAEYLPASAETARAARSTQ
jgi:glycosyltransferase involved in cell wall biosynthesis